MNTCSTSTKAFVPVKASSLSRARIVAVRANSDKVINQQIRKDEAKVVDTVTAGEVEKQTPYCRCWLSGTFPKCDGTHAKHNKETGDNVGPLLVKK